MDALRQALHRARDRYADLLLREVSGSLEEPTRERLEEELIELGWLSLCRTALERLGPAGPGTDPRASRGD